MQLCYSPFSLRDLSCQPLLVSPLFLLIISPSLFNVIRSTKCICFCSVRHNKHVSGWHRVLFKSSIHTRKTSRAFQESHRAIVFLSGGWGYRSETAAPSKRVSAPLQLIGWGARRVKNQIDMCAPKIMVFCAKRSLLQVLATDKTDKTDKITGRKSCTLVDIQACQQPANNTWSPNRVCSRRLPIRRQYLREITISCWLRKNIAHAEMGLDTKIETFGSENQKFRCRNVRIVVRPCRYENGYWLFFNMKTIKI